MMYVCVCEFHMNACVGCKMAFMACHARQHMLAGASVS